MPVIYAIKNKANGKCYVGSAAQVNKRWNSHRYMLRKGIHHSPALQRAWVKYSPDGFEFTILEQLTATCQIIVREQHWIDVLHASHPQRGYNVAPAAGTRAGVPQPESVRESSRALNLGVPKSAETRRKMSEAAKGKPKSEAHRQKLREAAQRQFSDPAARAAAAEKQRGKPNTMKGKTHSDESRKRMSDAAKRPERIECSLRNLPVMTQEIRDRIGAANAGRILGPTPKKRTPSEQEIARMKALRDQGATYQSIADQLGRDTATVHRYVNKPA